MLGCQSVKANLYLEHQSDGYFTNDHLIAQVLHDIKKIIYMYIFTKYNIS